MTDAQLENLKALSKHISGKLDLFGFNNLLTFSYISSTNHPNEYENLCAMLASQELRDKLRRCGKNPEDWLGMDESEREKLRAMTKEQVTEMRNEILKDNSYPAF